jgi:soluble lytic murein transglycosylase-like protein
VFPTYRDIMKKLIKVSILALIVYMSMNTVSAQAPVRTIDQYSPKELVAYYAKEYGVSSVKMSAVIKCESSWNVKAVNWQDSHKLSKGSHGIAQFSQQTIEMYGKQIGLENPDPYNAHDAIRVMAYMWSKGKMTQWSCYSKLY